MRAILTYHSIDASGSAISVSPAAFRAHHRWLTSGRLRVLSLEALLSLDPQAGDAVAVTLDDGFLNTREPVLALLADRIPVTIFVVTGHVGGVNGWGGASAPGIPALPLLGWDDLERLAARGAAIEAHTHTHPALTAVSSQALEQELHAPREILNKRLGVSPAHLAYPYGAVDRRVAAAAEKAYRWGHTTDFRTLSGREAAHLLPRLDMYYFRAPGALEAWGTARFRRHVRWCRARRIVRAALSPRLTARGYAAGLKAR